MKEEEKVTDQQQEAPVADVLVSQTTALQLHKHLADQGRSFGSPADIFSKLGRIVERTWGTTDCPRFQDKAGGGWLIDLSSFLEGEMLYIMIRTVHGRRAVTALLEADEVEAFGESKEWQSDAARSPDGVDPEVAAAAAAIEGGQAPALPGQARPPAAAPVPQTSPEDPCLMVVMVHSRDAEGAGQSVQEELIRCKRVEVAEHVAKLMQRNVTQDDIEIWSCVSKPKVQVTF